jgi:hypothetical protein
MGHSVRHTPVLGFGKSDKKSKVAAHRHLRRLVHALEHDPSAESYPLSREVSDTRTWRKSPRSYDAETARLLPEFMRK